MPKGSEEHGKHLKKPKLTLMEKRLRKREKKQQKHQHLIDTKDVYEETI